MFFGAQFNSFAFKAGVIKWGTESGEKVDKYDCQNDMVLRTGKQVGFLSLSLAWSL